MVKGAKKGERGRGEAQEQQKENRGGRAASPTGATDASREASFLRYHSKLVQAFPHQPHVADLEVVDLVPEQPGFILAVDGFLSPAECDTMISIIETVGLNPPSKKDLRPQKGEALLNRESFAFEDPALSRALFGRLAPFLPADLEGRSPWGFTSRLRYYCYRKGQSFGQHVDQSIRVGAGLESEYTLLLYLNGAGQEPHGLAGGETVFWKTAREELLSVAPRQGTLLLHAHGRRCLMHEGAPVTRGCKYLFRADVVYSSKALDPCLPATSAAQASTQQG